MFDFTGKSDKDKVLFLTRNQSNLENKRRSLEPLWELENMLFRPRRFDLLRSELPGQQYGQRLYDGHPANNLNKHVRGLMGNMINRSVPWLSFNVARQKFMKNDDIKIYLQEAEEQILFSFGRSTFYDESPNSLSDGVAIGTGVMMPKDDLVNGRVAYQSIHPGESYLENDEFGNPAVYHRKFKMSAINAFEMFGDKLPDNTIKKVQGDKQDPFSENQYLYCLYKNANFRQNSVRSQDKLYQVFYIALDKDPVKTQLLKEDGQDFFAVTWRPSRETNQAYGTSISADALTEALILNKLGEKALADVHQEVEKALKASKGLKGRIHAGAKGRTYLKAGETIEELFRSRGGALIAKEWIEDLRASLDDKFAIRIFETIDPATSPQMTAFQFSRMQAERAVLAGNVGSLETEYLSQAVQVQWDFETRAGRMPDIPDILLNEPDAQIDVVYTGPLSRLQRSLIEGQGVAESLAVAREIASIWQNTAVKVKEMEFFEDAWIAVGGKQKLLKSDDEVAEILQAQAEAVQQQEQLDTAEQVASIASTVNQPIERDGPLALLGAGV